jgi:hypothetical protein
MYSNLSHQIAYLSSKDELVQLVTSILKGMMFPKPSEHISQGLYANLILNFAETNADLIFKHATSLEERIFFSSVLICWYSPTNR